MIPAARPMIPAARPKLPDTIGLSDSAPPKAMAPNVRATIPKISDVLMMCFR
nr:MAG TPA: hypothetical protein [Caudoviricetes sp.]DAZ31882.1 MAG TPA: hypothetical protein [Caudoviricetes sp.]